MPSKRLSFQIFRIMFLFRFHFKAQWSHFTPFLGSVSISWLGQQSLYLQIVPQLLKHVELLYLDITKYVTLVTTATALRSTRHFTLQDQTHH